MKQRNFFNASLTLKAGLLFASIVVLNSKSWAQNLADTGAKSYKLLVEPNKGSGIKFKIDFTFGTHEGMPLQAAGEIILMENDKKNIELINASFSVPISSIRTGHPLRDCHLRQAMGVKYEGSSYPGQDNCSASNYTLPEQGPNAIAFPNITFNSISSQTKKVEPNEPNGPNTYLVAIKGAWNIHGVELVNSDDSPFIFKVTQTDYGYTVSNKINFKLSDYGVVVRKITKGPITVSVSNDVKLELNLKMVAQ